MQVPETVLSRAPWRKSTWSGDGNATCVEAVAIEVTSTDEQA